MGGAAKQPLVKFVRATKMVETGNGAHGYVHTGELLFARHLVRCGDERCVWRIVEGREQVN